MVKISDVEKANRFLKETFVPKFNTKFSALLQKRGNLHRSLTKFEKTHLDKIFSVQNTRTVNDDFTIRLKKKWFQLLETQPTLVLRKDKVQVEERIDGPIFISLKNKYLNYQVLPARPGKIKMKVVALTRTKSFWIPSLNHPWKKSFVFFLQVRRVSSIISVPKRLPIGFLEFHFLVDFLKT